MKTIWKYALLPGHNRLEMPFGARVLSVANQAEAIVLWALVDPEHYGPEVREFYVAATGENWYPPEDARFIGTVLVHGGALVWHVFEVVE